MGWHSFLGLTKPGSFIAVIVSSCCIVMPANSQYNAMMPTHAGPIADNLNSISHSKDSNNTFYLAYQGGSDSLKYLDSNNKLVEGLLLNDIGNVFVLAGHVIAIQHASKKVFISDDVNKPTTETFKEIHGTFLTYPEIIATEVIDANTIEIYYSNSDPTENCFYVATVDIKGLTLTNEKVDLPNKEDRVSAFCYSDLTKGMFAIVNDSIYSVHSDHSLVKVVESGFQGITKLFTIGNEFYGWDKHGLYGVIYNDGKNPTTNKWTILGKVNDINVYANEIILATEANSLWHKTQEVDSEPTLFKDFWQNVDPKAAFGENDNVVTFDNNSGYSDRFYANVIPKSLPKSDLYYSVHAEDISPLSPATIPAKPFFPATINWLPYFPATIPWKPYTPATKHWKPYVPSKHSNYNLGLIIGLSVGIPAAITIILLTFVAIYRYKNKK